MSEPKERSPAKHQSELDKAGQLALESVAAAALARREATTNAGRAQATEAANKGMDVANALRRLGATLDLGKQVAGPSPDRLRLDDLVQLDTPDARLLLDILEHAQIVAERVDASRGHALPDDVSLLPGESRGTDLAESISEIALRLRLDIAGPRGRE